jgi:hypothetical protein
MINELALDASPRLLDLIFQRGDFAPENAKGMPPDGKAPRPARLPQDVGDQAVRRYAQAALDRARSDVASCPQGSRGHMRLQHAARGLQRGHPSDRQERSSSRP